VRAFRHGPNGSRCTRAEGSHRHRDEPGDLLLRPGGALGRSTDLTGGAGLVERDPSAARGFSIPTNLTRLVTSRVVDRDLAARADGHAGTPPNREPPLQSRAGAPSTPTPTGRFAVSERVSQPDPQRVLRPPGLLLTAYSDTLDPATAARGQISIHGRAGASLRGPLGTAHSHGCIRIERPRPRPTRPSCSRKNTGDHPRVNRGMPAREPGPRTFQIAASRSGPFASSYRMMIASAKMHRDQKG
jgi:L,D-transpeptidase catalytic domain